MCDSMTMIDCVQFWIYLNESLASATLYKIQSITVSLLSEGRRIYKKISNHMNSPHPCCPYLSVAILRLFSMAMHTQHWGKGHRDDFYAVTVILSMSFSKQKTSIRIELRKYSFEGEIWAATSVDLMDCGNNIASVCGLS